MLSFKKWLMQKPIICPDNEKQLLDDIVADESFPHSVQFPVMLNYLTIRCCYDDDQLNIFKTYYKEYIKYITRDQEDL